MSDNGLRVPTADDGEIIADLVSAEEAWAAAVLCHPHPAYGGDRHNIVVDTFFRRLPSSGISALRFDFRSDDLATARADVTAAIDHVAATHPGGQPLWLVGYSFGGDVALSVGDPRLAGWIAVAPPLRFGGDGDGGALAAASDERPVLLLAVEHDQFNPPDRMREEASTWRNATVEAIAGADHFMAGATARVVETALAWLPR